MRAVAAVDLYEADFDRVQKVLAGSQAVMNVPASRLIAVCAEPTMLFPTFSLQLEGQSRVPHAGFSDAVRTRLEQAVFPNYASEIRFAALSLTGVGQTAYGDCSVQFKEFAVKDRSTVFDSPLFVFVEAQGLGLAEPIPLGYRARWADRGMLAATKFGLKCKGLADNQVADMLLPPPTSLTSDCVEVHIFGPLNRDSIESVVLSPVADRADRLLQRAVHEKLADVGIAVRTFP